MDIVHSSSVPSAAPQVGPAAAPQGKTPVPASGDSPRPAGPFWTRAQAFALNCAAARSVSPRSMQPRGSRNTVPTPMPCPVARRRLAPSSSEAPDWRGPNRPATSGSTDRCPSPERSPHRRARTAPRRLAIGSVSARPTRAASASRCKWALDVRRITYGMVRARDLKRQDVDLAAIAGKPKKTSHWPVATI